jgi:secondary thiamine-phosphate synthase enzyme
MEVRIKTSKKLELIDITLTVREIVKEVYAGESGAILCFVPHTTAAITITEAADPDVALDIESFLKSHLPAGLRFRHMEGNSDAHIISTLIGSSVVIPVESGVLKLGRWQGIFFVEADGPRERSVLLKKI